MKCRIYTGLQANSSPTSSIVDILVQVLSSVWFVHQNPRWLSSLQLLLIQLDSPQYFVLIIFVVSTSIILSYSHLFVSSIVKAPRPLTPDTIETLKSYWYKILQQIIKLYRILVWFGYFLFHVYHFLRSQPPYKFNLHTNSTNSCKLGHKGELIFVSCEGIKTSSTRYHWKP